MQKNSSSCLNWIFLIFFFANRWQHKKEMIIKNSIFPSNFEHHVCSNYSPIWTGYAIEIVEVKKQHQNYEKSFFFQFSNRYQLCAEFWRNFTSKFSFTRTFSDCFKLNRILFLFRKKSVKSRWKITWSHKKLKEQQFKRTHLERNKNETNAKIQQSECSYRRLKAD